jgi:hypothetical protein
MKVRLLDEYPGPVYARLRIQRETFARPSVSKIITTLQCLSSLSTRLILSEQPSSA